MDETAVFFEDPRRDTVDFTGARHVVLLSTGHGDKAATSLICKGTKKPIQNTGAVYVAYQERAWMNSELLIEWIDLMLPALLNFCDGKGIVQGTSEYSSRSKIVYPA
uniref:DDE-1 domain-containing protein n=1 Tax=Hyaloperonospora arabidopsidis (strain Emoy2) TaxID=559515 RepID=M4BR70_HYAAE